MKRMFLATLFAFAASNIAVAQQQQGSSNTDMTGPGEGVSMSPRGTTMGNGPDRGSTYYPAGHEPGQSQGSNGQRR